MLSSRGNGQGLFLPDSPPCPMLRPSCPQVPQILKAASFSYQSPTCHCEKNSQAGGTFCLSLITKRCAGNNCNKLALSLCHKGQVQHAHSPLKIPQKLKRGGSNRLSMRFTASSAYARRSDTRLRLSQDHVTASDAAIVRQL
jgi:hypothetical protein